MTLTRVHQSLWAKTSLENPVEMYEFRCTDSPAKKPLIFIGGVHGDEPEGVRLAQELIGWLQKNHIPQTRTWYVIPCLNVDGYRKNTRTNAAGVDLNRNFPAEDWNNEFSQARYFPGPRPNSEPEVQALVQWIETHQPECIFHFHSWIPSIVYTGNSGKPWAEPLAKVSGYELQETIGYPTPGSLGQYGWLNHKIPVICVEEQDGIELSSIWARFEKAFETLINL